MKARRIAVVAACGLALLLGGCVGGPASALRQVERVQRDQEREMAAQRRDMAREDRAATRQSEREEEMRKRKVSPGEEIAFGDQAGQPPSSNGKGKKAVMPFVTIEDPNKVIEGYDQHQTLDAGTEGERRMIHLASNKGQRPKIIVLAQIPSVGAPEDVPSLWSKTAEQDVRGNIAGLVFVGTTSESENTPEISCSIDGRATHLFGFMKKGKTPLYSVTNKALVWTLDANYQPTPVSGKKILCGT